MEHGLNISRNMVLSSLFFSLSKCYQPQPLAWADDTYLALDNRKKTSSNNCFVLFCIIGALYARNPRADTPLHPMFFGGGQERNFRPGTENTGMIAGLGQASQLVVDNLEQYHENMKMVSDIRVLEWGEKDSRTKQMMMLIILVRGVNFRFCSHLQ